MIRAIRTAILAAGVATALACAAPATASAAGPAAVICGLTGLVSGAAHKACNAVTHPQGIISAGGKLISGGVGGLVKDATAATAKAGAAVIVGLVVGAARYLLDKTASVIGASTRPNLTSTWFSASYWRMAAVSALLTLPFLFAAAIQAMVRSDLALLARAAFGYLPLGLIAVGIAAPVTMLLLSASDEMSAIIASASGHADASFLAKVSVLTGLAGAGLATEFVAFFVALLTVAATIVLWIELLIREAAIYVIVLMLPLFFAAMVWPARRIWAVRSVELLVALILSKFAIVAVLSLGGAALGHALLPGPASILSGATLVLLAAFSPWALLRLLPLHELASAAVGGFRMQATGTVTSSARTVAAIAGGTGEAAAAQLARHGAREPDRLTEPERVDGAPKGEPRFETPVSAGPGVAAAGAPGGQSSNGTGASEARSNGPDEEQRGEGMDAQWQAPDGAWQIRFGREGIDSRRPLIAPGTWAPAPGGAQPVGRPPELPAPSTAPPPATPPPPQPPPAGASEAGPQPMAAGPEPIEPPKPEPPPADDLDPLPPRDGQP